MIYNVLIISGDNPQDGVIGGKHTHIRLLEAGFSHNGISHHSLYPAHELSKTTYLEYLDIGLHHGIKAFTNTYIRHSQKVIKTLIEEIRKNTFIPDIIHCQDVLSFYAARQFLKEGKYCKPVVLTLHGYFAQEAVDYAQKSSKLIKSDLLAYGMKIERETVPFASKIIAVDTRIKDYLVKEFSFDVNDIIVLPNATDIDEFSPVDKNTMVSLRKKYGYRENDIIILVPRRLVPKNGVQYAIESIKSQSNPQLKLIIIGDGPLMADLKEISIEDSRIELVGAIPHYGVHEFYKLSDIILIPSITSNNVQEATSLSMLEGMACGKVVICSNIGGMKEVIKDGITGYLIEEKRPELLASLIQKIISSEETNIQMSQQARQYIVDNHSYLSHAAKHLTIYEEILREMK